MIGRDSSFAMSMLQCAEPNSQTGHICQPSAGVQIRSLGFDQSTNDSSGGGLHTHHFRMLLTSHTNSEDIATGTAIVL